MIFYCFLIFRIIRLTFHSNYPYFSIKLLRLLYIVFIYFASILDYVESASLVWDPYDMFNVYQWFRRCIVGVNVHKRYMVGGFPNTLRAIICFTSSRN